MSLWEWANLNPGHFVVAVLFVCWALHGIITTLINRVGRTD